VLLILLIASATQQTMLAQATDEPEGGLSQPLPSAAIKFGSYGADKDEGKDTDRAKEASVKHLQGEEMCSVAAKSGETSGSGQSPTRASSEVASEGASAASKSKKKKGKAKPEGPIAPLPPPSGEVAQLLHLLQRKSFHHLLEQEDKEGALLLLKLTEKFMAGGNMGLAEPVIDAVAVSLADQIAKVAKKDRPGMVAVLRALVDQQIDPEIKRRRYEALFAPAESGIVGRFVSV
jgi:hypothetical protein